MIRQSWPFFQNDFAGRIANRVMQTAHALRDSVMASIRAVWYIGVVRRHRPDPDGGGGLAARAADARLVRGYFALLWLFVPRMRDLSRMSSEARSLVMARVVDSYTNVLTVKLFARATDEDAYVRESIDEHGEAMRRHMRVMTRFHFLLTAMNAGLLVATAAIGIWLWANGAVGAGIVAAALPLAWQTFQRRRLGELGGDRDLRERRRGAGRHAVDRGAALGCRPAGRAAAGSLARRDPLREREFRLRAPGCGAGT